MIGKIKGGSDIDEIGVFIGLSRKSNISINQCAQGFSLMNILKNRGIEMVKLLQLLRMFLILLITIENVMIIIKNYQPLLNMVIKIVKNFNTPPTIIHSWVKDILDFNSSFSSSFVF